MKRIIFTGAQGTGKSTILNYFKDKGMNCITEVVRNLSKEGIKINELGDEEGQQKIFNTYAELLSEQKDYISDRGLTDVLSYTNYLMKEGSVSIQFGVNQYIDLISFLQNNPDVIYCYFPIEFGVVDDGVRSTNEEFRNYIDVQIKAILDRYVRDYYTITGTVNDRIKQIESILTEENY